jgi:RimJ/RimL family protein N-acetyltransferase
MELRPTLEGPTVRLQPTREDDFGGLYAAAADPLVWAQHPVRERWREEVFRRYFEAWLLNDGALAIRERASGRIVGASRYSLEARLPGEVEIGWTFLARDHWGGATNREVKRLMIGHALEAVERVVFRIAETNLRSRRAVEKIGAVLTDRVEAIEIGGRPLPHLVYALGRDAAIMREAL